MMQSVQTKKKKMRESSKTRNISKTMLALDFNKIIFTSRQLVSPHWEVSGPTTQRTMLPSLLALQNQGGST